MSAALAPRYEPPPDDTPLLGGMPLLDHLEELRSRAIRALIAVVAGVVVAFAFMVPIEQFVLAPVHAVLPTGSSLISAAAPDPRHR